MICFMLYCLFKYCFGFWKFFLIFDGIITLLIAIGVICYLGC